MKAEQSCFPRGPELQELTRLLNEDKVPAVFLVSGPGMGVTALIERLRRRLSLRRPVLLLRGTPALKTLRFGGLASLAGAMPAESLHTEPGAAVRALHEAFAEQREQLQGTGNHDVPVVLVDHADALDTSSLELLASLVMNRDIAVVFSQPQSGDLEPALLQLWDMGLAEELELTPLDRGRTSELAEQLLGAPLLPGLEWRLWQDSGGSPTLVKLLLEEARERGAISQRRDVWVAIDAQPWSGEGLRPIISEQLHRLEALERNALNAIALGGPLERAHVVSHFGQSAVEVLLAKGFIAESAEHPGMLEMISHVYGVVVRSLVPATLSRILLDGLGDLEQPENSPMSYLRRTQWSISSGIPVSEERLLRAATIACRFFENDTAQNILELVPGGEHFAWQSAIRARIHFNQGHYAEVLHIASDLRIRTSGLGQLHLSLLQAGATTAMGASPALIAAQALQLRELAQQLESGTVSGPDTDQGKATGPAPTPGPPQGKRAKPIADFPAALRRRALILESLHALQGGDMQTLAHHLAEVMAQAGEPEDLHASVDLSLAMALDAERLLALGRSEEAFTRAKQAFQRVHDESVEVYFLPEMVILRLLLIAIVSGQAEEAQRFAMAINLDQSSSATAFGGGTSLLSGFVLNYQGEAEKSLEALMAGLENLKIQDPLRLRGFFTANAYMGAALAGDEKAAGELRESLPEGSSLMFGVTMQRAFRACGDLIRGLPGALDELQAEAERARSKGQAGFQALILALLFAYGERQSPEQLRAVVGEMSGAWAARVREGLDALISSDTATMLTTAPRCEQGGMPWLARRLYLRVVQIATIAGDGLTAHQAREELKKSSHQLPGDNSEAVIDAPQLTRREHEIVVLARSGHSDAAIAASLHLSIRTVSGHLSRAYRKLGVSSRHQLAEVYQD